MLPWFCLLDYVSTLLLNDDHTWFRIEFDLRSFDEMREGEYVLRAHSALEVIRLIARISYLYVLGTRPLSNNTMLALHMTDAMYLYRT